MRSTASVAVLPLILHLTAVSIQEWTPPDKGSDAKLHLRTYINSVHEAHLQKCFVIRLIEDVEGLCRAFGEMIPQIVMKVCKSKSTPSSLCQPVASLKQVAVVSCLYYILSGSPDWLIQVLLEGERNGIFKSTDTIIFTTHVSNYDILHKYHSIYYTFPYTLFLATDDSCNVKQINIFSVNETWQPIPFHADSTHFSLSKLYKKLDNLQGMQLTIAVELAEPYTYKADRSPVSAEEMRNMNLDQYDGIDMRMLKMIKRMLNFTIKMFVPEHRGWGQIVNGSWVGMIGAVDRKEADMALTCIAITNLREEAADFTYPYFLDPVTFVSPIPKLLPQWTTITYPLPFLVWVLIIISLPAISLMFWLISRSTIKVGIEEKSWGEFLKAWVTCVQALCGQTSSTLPQSNASRVILMTWMLCSKIVTAIYSGILLSFLTSPLREKPILTVAEVVRAEGLKWGHLDYGGLYEELYMKSGRQDFFRVWKGTELVTNHNECVSKVINGRYICFDYKSIVERYVVNKRYHKKPDVIFASDTFFGQLLAFAFQHNSPIKHKFDKIIMDLRANGFIAKWTRDFLLSKEKLSSEIISADAGEVSLTLSIFQGGFFLLLLGYALGLISFVTEYYWECNGNRSQTRETANEYFNNRLLNRDNLTVIHDRNNFHLSRRPFENRQ